MGRPKQIMSQIIRNAYQQMRKCMVTADSTAIPFEEVQKAIADGDDAVLCGLRDKVVMETHDTSVEGFNGELMNTLDGVFEMHYVTKANAKEGPVIDECFAADTPEGRDQWRAYHADVIDEVKKYVSTPRAGWPVGALSRIALLLYWSPSDKNLPLPILGELSVLAITHLCSRLPLAIMEVSSYCILCAANPSDQIGGAAANMSRIA
jgi:hypothetical protein